MADEELLYEVPPDLYPRLAQEGYVGKHVVLDADYQVVMVLPLTEEEKRQLQSMDTPLIVFVPDPNVSYFYATAS